MVPSMGKAHSPQTNHPNYHTGTQPGRKWDIKNDRLESLWGPNPPRPEWESSEWWAVKANALPGRDCGKNNLHGPCTVRYSTMFSGRTLAYHCLPCGWTETVLVQEGALAPVAPDRTGTLPMNGYQKAWAAQDMGTRMKNAQTAARARRSAFKKRGFVKRKEWWEDV